jgi:hypothetical protein
METKEERRARIIAEVEALIAETRRRTWSRRSGDDWQYPPSPIMDTPPDRPLARSTLVLLAAIGAVAAIAFVFGTVG